MAINADRIRKSVRKLRKFIKKCPKRPSAAQVHDLRTNSRRIETALEVFGLTSKNERRMLRELARVRKRAGKIRDIDVLIGCVLASPTNGEQDCLVQLLEALGEIRAKSVKKLRASVATVGPDLRCRLKRSRAKIESLLQHTQNRGAGAESSSEAKTAALRLAEELQFPAHLNKGNLHPYRLKVKELRYTLQLAADANRQEFVKKLGEVKDAIGEWHDWEELVKLADRELDHGRKCKLLPKFRSIRETKFNTAFALTSRLRHKFLLHGPRIQGVAPGHRKPLAKSSVLSAVSAMSA